MSEAAGTLAEVAADHRLFETFLFAMIGGRLDEVRPLLAPDVLWHLPPFAKAPPFEGVEAVMRFLEEAPAQFYAPGSMTIEPVFTSVEAGNAACLATLRATTKHGKPYENRYGFFARVRRGQLVEVWELLDTVRMQEQMKS